MNIDESLARLMESGTPSFSELFYRVLFQQFPQLEPHFVDLDMIHQGALLTMALATVVRHAESCNRATENYLKVLGHRHYRRGITAHDYDQFRDAVLVALAEFHGGDWSEPLADEWRETLRTATDTMLRWHTDEQVIY